MLAIAQIKNQKEELAQRLGIRGLDGEDLLNQVLALDEKRRAIQQEADAAANEMNVISKQIGQLFKEGKTEEANAAKAKTGELKEKAKTFADQLQAIENEQRELLYTIPNAPHTSVPKGNSEEDNEVVKSVGEIPEMADDALPHWELAKKYNVFDLELGVKLTGAGFPVYRNKGAKLQRALIQLFLDNATAMGYEEIQPPLMINEASGIGTGQLPDKEGQMYHVTADDFYLIPTAEVPITNLFRDMILDEDAFPIKMCGYTPCFRREAGSYGKDVKGLNRLHQFDKVEIVQFAHPDKSYQVLEEMVTYVETLLVKLELPYRILRLCGGDLSFASALTYDFEVWSAAQGRWLEVSSISNFETFQANRMKCRYRDADNKKHLVHTLNGSALALPRIVASLLENHQTSEGIRIPEALAKYTGFDLLN